MRITCVHQGYELYGSDRCFTESVAAMRAAFPDARIDVVLPRHGPIESRLDGNASRIIAEPIWVLRRRNIGRLATLGLLRLPFAIARAVKRCRSSDVVYINTTVVIDYLVAARLFPRRAILHIHEIPEGMTLSAFRALVRFSRATVIFNSRTTRDAFALPGTVRSSVIYNGVAGPLDAESVTYDGMRKLRVLMLGRISAGKGQDVLLRALRSLPPTSRSRVDVRIVGSAFEDPGKEQGLRDAVLHDDLGDIVSVEPFVDDPGPLYRWADIVVVPSVRAESLGRVAIEAMSYGRPPIASAIGGLLEVVEHGRSGWLTTPGDAAGLAQILQNVIADPRSWQSFGGAARARYEATFSEASAATALVAIISSMDRQPGGVASAGELATRNRP